MIGKRSSFFNWVRQESKQAGCWDGTIDVFITPRREAPTVSSPSVATILRDHVSLSISCVDRLYLNGYVPRLQAPGHISTFCRQQLNAAIASPALFGPLLERFAKDVKRFADQHAIPIIHFSRGQKKDRIAAQHRADFDADEGVVFIGIAQEKATSFKGQKHVSDQAVSFTFSRQSVYVNQVYFYLQDREWGPAFIKVGTYLPYPVRVCLNGHVRHEALLIPSGDERAPPLGCRSSLAKLRAVLIPEARGRVGAALTTTRRAGTARRLEARQARWKGVREEPASKPLK